MPAKKRPDARSRSHSEMPSTPTFQTSPTDFAQSWRSTNWRSARSRSKRPTRIAVITRVPAAATRANARAWRASPSGTASIASEPTSGSSPMAVTQGLLSPLEPSSAPDRHGEDDADHHEPGDEDVRVGPHQPALRPAQARGEVAHPADHRRRRPLDRDRLHLGAEGVAQLLARLHQELVVDLVEAVGLLQGLAGLRHGPSGGAAAGRVAGEEPPGQRDAAERDDRADDQRQGLVA